MNRTAGFLAAMSVICIVLLAAASSSLADVTLGVGWSTPGRNVPEMPLVGASGASAFRTPMPPANENDGVVRAAAENDVTIHAEVSTGNSLPTGGARAAFIEGVAKEVERYGYNGDFWQEPGNASLPYKPITTWEVWNEPNQPEKNIGASAYGTFLTEVAAAIQAASKAQAGVETDVLSGGLYAQGNKANFEAALGYLEGFYPTIAANKYVTGIAVHPYELFPSTFHSESFTRTDAFRYALEHFHSKVVELAGSNPAKSLWITEAGWPVGHEAGVGESEQASLLGEAVDVARSHESSFGIRDFLWYNFRDLAGGEKWDNWCGLRADDGHFRASWTEFQAKTGHAQFIPQAPSVETGSATEIRSSRALLNGTVDPRGLPTKYRFEYGTSPSYGKSVPQPEGSVGAGASPTSVSASPEGLAPGTTYHYRIVATNAIDTTYGADRTFTTAHEYPRVSFADAASSNSMTTWAYENASRWSQLPFFGDEIAKGTHPSAILINNQPHVFFVDASKSNSIADWNWNPTTGWQLTPFFGDQAAPGTSPSAAILNGTPHVFFNDATHGESMTAWVWNGTTGWGQLFLYGHKLAEHTSPSAAMLNGTPHVFFSDATDNDTLTAWTWTPTLSWTELHLWGHQVAPGTSPSAADLNGTPHVFFNDATDNETMSAWSWTPSLSWTELHLWGDQVAAGTSPSAVQAGETPHVFFVDATKGNTLTAWNWTPALSWNELRLGGDPIAAGTSPSAISAENRPHVFFVDSAQGGTLTDWNWDPTSSWHETRLGGHAVTAGTSPGGWVSE